MNWKSNVKSNMFNMAVVFSLILFTGCTTKDSNLYARIGEYFNTEKNGDWAKIYSMRTNDFRKMVHEDQFISDMREATEGWVLLKYEIKGISINQNVA